MVVGGRTPFEDADLIHTAIVTHYRAHKQIHTHNGHYRKRFGSLLCCFGFRYNWQVLSLRMQIGPILNLDLRPVRNKRIKQPKMGNVSAKKAVIKIYGLIDE